MQSFTLNFLIISKDYYKPQQFTLKPPTENDIVSFREPASFCKNIFSGTLSRKQRFSGNFKTSIQNAFS